MVEVLKESTTLIGGGFQQTGITAKDWKFPALVAGFLCNTLISLSILFFPHDRIGKSFSAVRLPYVTKTSRRIQANVIVL
jgi:hypothetical protein